MAARQKDILQFNRGVVSELALARVNIERVSMSALIQKNWMPRSLGPMSLRPGLGLVGEVLAEARAYFFPFVFAIDDRALLEFSDETFRVWIDGDLLTRPSVDTVITNGGFGSNVNSWTDADEAGAASVWDAGGYMSLTGTGFLRAIRTQTVTVGAPDRGTEHALRINVLRGPVVLRVGSTSGGDEYVTETKLGTGEHSLSFTPTNNFYIHLSNRLARTVLIDSIEIESAGVVSLTTFYEQDSLPLIRIDQSADVVYIACEGVHQYKLERRSIRSWSYVLYESEDGPFRVENLDEGLTITPNGLSGSVTLTSSSPLFRASHVPSIWSIRSTGQLVTHDVTGQAQWTDWIKVTGVGDARAFLVSIGGTWVGTVTLQKSVGEPGVWADAVLYSVNTGAYYNDLLDNQVIYYRIGVDTGEYTSGTVNLGLSFSGGSKTGIVRVDAFTSSTIVSASVLKPLGNVVANSIWSEGAWSEFRGFPSSAALHDGRLWWAAKNYNYGSVSDAYESFDDEVEGDAGPIVRSIGKGPVDNINWLLSLSRLMLGTAGTEWAAKASSLDEPLTPSGYSLKSISGQGSAKVPAVTIDSEGVYVQRAGKRVYQLTIDPSTGDYASNDMTSLAPKIGRPGIQRIAVQRQPDTRIHCVRSDGTAAVLVYDRVEQVKAWITIETEGTIEDVVVLPGDDEDEVYYVVLRDNGRYLERWALEDDCVGGTLNQQLDSYITYTAASFTTVSGLSHLEGQTVGVWADGVDRGTFVVSSGSIDIGTPATSVVVGLVYDALYESVNLNELNMTKRIHALTLIMQNTHAQGVQYGTDLNRMSDMPMIEDTDVDQDHVWPSYHAPPLVVDDAHDAANRLYITATAPRPATVLAAVVEYSAS